MIALLLFALFAPIMKMARGNPLWRRIGLSVIFVALIIALFSIGASRTPSQNCNETNQQGNC